MARVMYTIVRPIHGRLYRSLLEFGISRGVRFLLVEPPLIPLGPAARAVLESLGRHEVRNYASNSWPGTTLLRDTAKVRGSERATTTFRGCETVVVVVTPTADDEAAEADRDVDAE